MLYSELALAGLGLLTLVTLDFKKLRLLLGTHVLIITSVYLLGLIGMLYSPDIKEALNVGGRQLAILLFPLVLTLNGIDLNKYKSGLLKIFGFTCVVAVLYLYAAASYTIHYSHLPFKSLFTADFMNHNFSLPIQLHATYLSMYAAFAITVFIYLFQKNSQVLLRIFYSVCIIILLAGMIQLSSRAVLVALFLIVNIIFPICHLGGKKRLQFIIMATVLSTVTLFSIYNVDSFKTRYVGELKNDLGIDTLNVEFTEPRVDRWKAQIELIKGSPIVGYGSGSEKKMLKKKFLEKQFYIAYAGDYNSHSQYLSFLLNMGILGLALYLFVLCYSVLFAWKDRDIIFLGFMIIISVVSFSENILFLNKGIFFYSFFLSLFLFTCSKKGKAVS
jgi:O-antigen ligase